jgi:NAD(P)-dependent dehydrogenase (short-subunit alcohol dehydrogenase family)
MAQPLKMIITGASSGIGRAVALEFASGNRLFITSRRTEKLNEVAKEIEAKGGEAYVGARDIRDVNAVERLSNAALDNLGGVDVLFANAGIGFFGLLEQMTVEQYNLQFDTNVRGVFLWIKHLLPEMKRARANNRNKLKPRFRNQCQSKHL